MRSKAAAVGFVLAIALPVWILDQITKFVVIANLGVHDAITVIPGFFDLVHVHNTGAAFGMMRNNNTFFIGLSAVATIVLLVLTARRAFPDAMTRTAAGLLLGGVWGNLTDRLIHGHVVDFLHFYHKAWAWPAFNLADSCICVAAGLFILKSFFEDPPPRPAP